MSMETAKYLNLGTFRKSGIKVDTPVWFASANGYLYAFSNSDSGKVKRLKNNSRCQVAACTMLGTPTGIWEDSFAVLLNDPVEVSLAHDALKRKYGWQMLLLDGGAWIGGRLDKRTYIKIRKP